MIYTVTVGEGTVTDSVYNDNSSYNFSFTTVQNTNNNSDSGDDNSSSNNNSNSGGGGNTTQSLKDIDGDVEVDKTKNSPTPKIDISKDRDAKAPVSLKTVKDMKEANKTIVVENAGVKIGFKPDSIQAKEIKEELEKELAKDLEYESVKVILGAEEITKAQTQEIIEKAKIGESTGLFEIGGKVFDMTANIVKEKDGKTTEEKIERFNEPVQVTIDLSDIKLTKEDIAKLTAVRHEKDEQGNVEPVKLGGSYDPETKTFTFYTDQFSLYSVVKADKLLEIDLVIGQKEGLVNKKAKENDVAPQIINDRTMVPVRFVAENMGALVGWNEEKREVTIELDEDKLSMTIDMPIEGFDTPPTIVNNRTLVPIRYVSETLGAKVMWFPTDKKVHIVK